MRLSSLLRIVLLGAALLAAGAGIAYPLLPGAPVRLDTLAFTGLALVVGAIMGLGLSTALDRGKARWLMRFGLVLLVAGLLAWLGRLWVGGSFGRQTARHWEETVATLLGSAGMLAIIGIQLAQPARSRPARWIRRGTVVVCFAIMIGLPVVIWADLPRRQEEMLARGLSALGVLVGGGLLAAMVLARLHEIRRGPRSADTPTVLVTCPRCGCRQELHMEADVCARCALRIRIELT